MNNNMFEQMMIVINDIKNKKYGNCKQDFLIKTKFPELYQWIIERTSFLDNEYDSGIRFRSRLACILNNVMNIPKCANANCNVKLDLRRARPDNKFPVYCCAHCSLTDPARLLKAQNTKKERYGDPNYCNADKAKKTISEKLNLDPDMWTKIENKRKQTRLEKYGDENYVNFEKSKKTKLLKYGDENYSNREKAKQTYLAKSESERRAISDKVRESYMKHVNDDPMFRKSVIEKRFKTCEERYGKGNLTNHKKCVETVRELYGVDNVFQRDDIKKKICEENLNKYGTEYYSSTEECREKVRNTVNEKYGYDNVLEVPEIKEKIKQYNIDNYGVEHNWQREDVKDKIKKTNLEKYGYEYAAQNPEIRSKSSQKYILMCIQKYGTTSYFSSDEYKKHCIEKYGVDHPMKNNEFRKNQQQKYVFNELKFDSQPEIAYYIWLTDNNVEFEYQPEPLNTMQYEYFKNGEMLIACYFPDFKVGDHYIEIKGDQFFKPDGTMYCPYRDKDWSDAEYADVCEKFEAKRQCMLKHNVRILREAEYNEYIEYVEKKYGKDFLKKFKNVVS